jgi:hypothetical protein
MPSLNAPTAIALTAGLSVVGLFLGPTSLPAAAAPGGPCDGRTCFGGDASSSSDGLTADGGADRGPVGGGPDRSTVRGPDHDPCIYRSLSAHELLAWHISYAWQGNDDPPDPGPDAFYGDDPQTRWALAHCPADVGREVLVWWPIGGRPPASLISALRARARDSVPFPVLAQRGAPSGDRDAPFITQLPTWLWVDGTRWHAVHADATIPGIVAVTATGVPMRIRWDPGTGDPEIRCEGPGVPYDPTQPDDRQATTCSYTYRHSSAMAPNGRTYPLTLAVEWDVTWECSPGCGRGPMPPVTITTTRQVWVAELQALNDRGLEP